MTQEEYWKKNKLDVQSIGSESMPVYRIKITGSYSVGAIDVFYNPFHNCQTGTIASIWQIANLENFAFARLLSFIYHSCLSKKQIVLDIQQGYVNKVIDQFKPFILEEKTKKMPYRSTNGSSMVLILIVLSASKMSLLRQHLTRNNLHNADNYAASATAQTKLSPKTLPKIPNTEPKAKKPKGRIKEEYEVFLKLITPKQ